MWVQFLFGENHEFPLFGITERLRRRPLGLILGVFMHFTQESLVGLHVGFDLRGG